MVHKKPRWMAAFAIVAAILLMFTMVCVNPASAETEEATDISGFDSYSDSGVTNDGTVKPTGEDYSIQFANGWGEFDLAEFGTVDIDFKLHFDTDEDEFEVILENDAADVENKVTITFETSSATQTKVFVDDEYAGESNDFSNYESVASVFTGDNDFVSVSIEIYKTSSNTDGKTKAMDVKVGSETIIDGFVLLPSTYSSDMKERQWDKVTFASQEAAYNVNVDQIDIDTNAATTWGLNYKAIMLIFVVFVGGLLWVTKSFPFDGNTTGFKTVSRK